jgi:hypothetical protein
MGYGWALDDAPGSRKTSTAEDVRRKTMNRQLGKVRKITPFGEAFVETLIELRPLLTYDNVKPLAPWFERVVRCEESCVVTMVCPTYKTVREETSKEVIYTFDGLEDGIGIVAQRALPAHIALWKFFRDCGLGMRFILVMADNEADSAANLERVGVSREEFLKRVRANQHNTKAASPIEMPLETPLLSEVAGAYWSAALEAGKKRAHEIEDGGKMAGPFRGALQQRGKLYERWAGRPLQGAEKHAMLYNQIAEYGAVGRCVGTVFPNPFFLAADDPIMAPFVAAGGGPDLPLIYLERPRYY